MNEYMQEKKEVTLLAKCRCGSSIEFRGADHKLPEVTRVITEHMKVCIMSRVEK